MLTFHMFQFTMLFTSWCICSDNIMTSRVAQLIRLSLTLKTSLGLACSPGAQTVFDRERVLRSTISNSKQYRLYCTKRDVLTWTSPRWASQPYVRIYLLKHMLNNSWISILICPLRRLTQLVVNRCQFSANWYPIGTQLAPIFNNPPWRLFRLKYLLKHLQPEPAFI